MPDLIPARVRGLDEIKFVVEADVCWHCKGLGVCECAGCGHSKLIDGQFEVWPNVCQACHGTGCLVWEGATHMKGDS